MREPAFTAGKIAVTERGAEGDYVVRLMIPPQKGWRQSGMSQRFDTRAAAMAHAAALAVDQELATLYDFPTSIAPFWEGC